MKEPNGNTDRNRGHQYKDEQPTNQKAKQNKKTNRNDQEKDTASPRRCLSAVFLAMEKTSRKLETAVKSHKRAMGQTGQGCVPVRQIPGQSTAVNEINKRSPFLPPVLQASSGEKIRFHKLNKTLCTFPFFFNASPFHQAKFVSNNHITPTKAMPTRFIQHDFSADLREIETRRRTATQAEAACTVNHQVGQLSASAGLCGKHRIRCASGLRLAAACSKRLRRETKERGRVAQDSPSPCAKLWEWTIFYE